MLNNVKYAASFNDYLGGSLPLFHARLIKKKKNSTRMTNMMVCKLCMDAETQGEKRPTLSHITNRIFAR